MEYFIFFVTFTLTSDLNTSFFKSNDARQIYCIETFVTWRESYVASVKQVYCVPADHQSFENLVKCELNCWFSLNLPHSVRMNTKNRVLPNNENSFKLHFQLSLVWIKGDMTYLTMRHRPKDKNNQTGTIVTCSVYQ